MNIVPRTRMLTLALSLALAGCASFGQQNALQKPVDAAELTLSQGTMHQADPLWWRRINDPLLEDIMQRALTHSPDLALADAKVREAEALMRGADSKTGPQVAAHVGMDRQRYSEYGLMGGMVGGQFVNTYNAMLQGSWAFDFWGEHKNEVASVIGRRNAGALQAQQAQLGIAQAVFTQYTNWQNLMAQRSVLLQRLSVQKKVERLLTQRSNAGILAYNQVYPSQLSSAQIQAQVDVLNAQIEAVKYALAALSAQGPNALDGRTPQPLTAANAPNVPVSSLTVDLLGRRPDIAAQREVLLAQQHAIQAAKAQFYPNVKIEAFAGFQQIATGAPNLARLGATPPTSLSLGKLFSKAALALDFAPSITLPIFTSGALQANLAQKNAQYDQEVANYDKTVYNALRDAATALSDYRNAQSEAQARSAALAATRKMAASQMKRFQAGLDNKMNYLRQEDQRLAAEADWLSARAKIQSAYGSLNTALGGGWSADAFRQPERRDAAPAALAAH